MFQKNQFVQHSYTYVIYSNSKLLKLHIKSYHSH